MKANDFVSTPDDLLPAIIDYGNFLEPQGWKLTIEQFDLAFPRTPPLVAKRRQTTHIVEAQSLINLPMIREWTRYCKSRSRDTRLCVVLAGSGIPTDSQLDELKQLGVGLIRIGANGPHELTPPADLAMQFDPPEPPYGLKALLSEAYEHFDRGLWREGFEAAATAFEQEARRYLKLHKKRGRVQFVSSAGNSINYTEARIGRMTIGALAIAFTEIQTPNLNDTRIGQALSTINDDRITVAHFRQTSAAREKKLRSNVAGHMFVIINGMSYIRGLKP